MGNSKSKSEQTFRSRGGIIVDINGKVYNDVSPSSEVKNNIHYNKPNTNTAFPKSNDYKSYPNSERKQYSFHEIDKSHKRTFNDTIIQSKFVTETCEKEKYNNENQTNEVKNKFAIAAPHKISTKDDFMTEWFSWKDEFLKYMKSIDQAESNKQDWGIMLLNRMGPIGQEIYRTFLSDKNDAKDIDALLKQFDFYCIFGGRRRGDDEDIDEYVNNLMVMASKHMASTHEAVKEKILMEIDKGKFTRKAESLIMGFSFPSSIQSLTVKEITYIWMLYENVNFKRSEEIHNFIVKNCNNCGRTHKMYNCYARGKRCNKCGNENHYWTRCPSQFIDNCLYCGEAHFVRECPAYLNECNKCNRTNHFSWKCSISTVLNCNYCGLTHIASRSACSAANTICFICKRRGHVPSKCFKKSTYR
ncbi:uncharacterized protein LOC114932463 [Nylanderia fulva]|uniref:uncharacterized protein LOC114932463 n=1 Tax=Nylanderia fulva TaxID=613905 RepID=UPI0010FB8B71|nr:uncharacterized protein LOC114932463 [Nylanderia fulva]